MPTYKVKIREYAYTQYVGEDPDKDFVLSFTRTVQAHNVAEALGKAQAIVDELNGDQEVDEYQEIDGLPARRCWISYRFELEVPLSSKYLK